MTASRPYFLLTNDDGIHARGLQALVEALRPVADLVVVAPDGPRSGFSMAFTAGRSLHVELVSREEGLTRYACSGTPVDCVKIGLSQYCTRRPDLIVSGINHGDNSSVNSHYSGTMGAALEGALQGIPSIGFSLCSLDVSADFSPLLPYVRDLSLRTLRLSLPAFTCLNINFPCLPEFKGVKVVRMARSRWIKEVVVESAPCQDSGDYRLTGENVELEPEATDTDRAALAAGYVAVVPTTLDYTSYESLRAFSAPDSPLNFSE